MCTSYLVLLPACMFTSPTEAAVATYGPQHLALRVSALGVFSALSGHSSAALRPRLLAQLSLASTLATTHATNAPVLIAALAFLAEMARQGGDDVLTTASGAELLAFALAPPLDVLLGVQTGVVKALTALGVAASSATAAALWDLRGPFSSAMLKHSTDLEVQSSGLQVCASCCEIA